MSLVFKYAVIKAIPDVARGERVNVGILVFLPNRIDVRFAELSKMRALTGRDWDDYAIEAANRLTQRFTGGVDAQEEIASYPNFDPAFRASELAWFSVGSEAQYEPRIREILSTLVMRPRASDIQQKTTRINTEIAKQLRRIKALASHEETLESHKVVRNHVVEEELRADFAQMNGAMRVATTLDLRRPHVNLKETSLKAIILDRAAEIYGSDARRIGVYAARQTDIAAGRQHIKLLTDYADDIYNWEDQDDRGRFMNLVLSGLSVSGPLV